MTTKIYTSRYANWNLANAKGKKLRISLGYPKFPLKYEIDGSIIELAPPRYLFGKPEQVFKVGYFKHLDRLGINTIKRLLQNHGYGKEDEIVLLCYEDITKEPVSENWCHRRIFAEWWEKQTGEKVEEYQDDRTYAAKTQKETQEEQYGLQISLFD